MIRSDTTVAVSNKPDLFKVKIENDLYFPGSLVKGVLSVTTRKNNTGYCGNLSIKLEGKSSSIIHSRRYAYCKRVLWGNIFSSPLFKSISDVRQNGKYMII